MRDGGEVGASGSLKSGARTPDPEAGSPKPEARSQNSEAWSREPAARSLSVRLSIGRRDRPQRRSHKARHAADYHHRAPAQGVGDPAEERTADQRARTQADGLQREHAPVHVSARLQLDDG